MYLHKDNEKTRSCQLITEYTIYDVKDAQCQCFHCFWAPLSIVHMYIHILKVLNSVFYQQHT